MGSRLESYVFLYPESTELNSKNVGRDPHSYVPRFIWTNFLHSLVMYLANWPKFTCTEFGANSSIRVGAIVFYLCDCETSAIPT